MNQLDLDARHVVITGGAAGLGYAIAERVLASGGSVTLWDFDAVALARAVETLGAKAHGVQVDVSQHSSVAQAVAATLAQHPRIDALVNSAGITGPNTKVWDYPVDDWARVIQVNLNGLFPCCRADAPRALPQLSWRSPGAPSRQLRNAPLRWT